MSCKTCPAQKTSCWLNKSLASHDAERSFKIKKNDHLDHTSAVCSSSTPVHLKRPIFWILMIDRHIARIIEKNAHLNEIALLIPKELDQRQENHKKEIDFVQDVILWLEEAAEKDLFDRLILCAPPHMLGEIRPLLTEHLAKHVVAEIDKDLTKLSEPELKQVFSEILWFA